MKSKTEKMCINIVIVVVAFVAGGIIMPILVKGDNNTAGTSQVLSGKTFSTGSVVGLTGAMQNFAGQIPEVTATVEAADEDYIATIDLDDGYYESVKINAKPIYDAGVTSGTNSLTGGNAAATQILKDKTAYVGGKLVTGTMVNNGKVTQTINPGASYTIPAGYHNGEGKVTANPNQNSGTYTYPANSTGGKTDMGVNNTNRYVDATNVYNKGKADGVTTHTETYSATTRAASIDLGAKHTYRYINTNSVPNTNSGTYTYAANSTGGTVDMGATNTYRYVNASNVYNKGKADGAAAGKSVKVEVYIDRGGYTYKVRLNGKEVKWDNYSSQTWMDAGTHTV